MGNHDHSPQCNEQLLCHLYSLTRSCRTMNQCRPYLLDRVSGQNIPLCKPICPTCQGSAGSSTGHQKRQSYSVPNGSRMCIVLFSLRGPCLDLDIWLDGGTEITYTQRLAQRLAPSPNSLRTRGQESAKYSSINKLTSSKGQGRTLKDPCGFVTDQFTSHSRSAPTWTD